MKKYLICTNLFKKLKEADVKTNFNIKNIYAKKCKTKNKRKGYDNISYKRYKEEMETKNKKLFERERYYSNCASSNYCSIADFGRSKLKCNISENGIIKKSTRCPKIK